MLGFALLLGHLLGDYVFQNDLIAKDKAHRYPASTGTDSCELARALWREKKVLWQWSHAICTLHCVIYASVIYLVTCPLHTFPYWFYLAVGIIHWPIDRYSLAKWWMINVSNQINFATGPLAPWSIIVIDNVFHLATLYVLVLLSVYLECNYVVN